MRADRLLGILLALEKKKKVTAEELAREFEVSVRTIYRDIEALSDFPIYADRGPGGGFSLMEGYRLGSLPLSKKEAAALTVMGSMTSEKMGLVEGRVFKQAFQKLLSHLPREVRAQADRFSELVLIDLEPWQAEPEVPGTAETINRALNESRVLEFTYRKRSRPPEEKEVEPYGLCYRGKFWYLVGFCRERKDFRLYRTDRVRDLAITRRTFARKGDFDLRKFWNEELPRQYRTRGVLARIAFDPALAPEIKKAPWACGELETLPDGRLEIRFRTFDRERLAGFVLGFGDRAELLEPEDVRTRIRDTLRSALEKYRELRPTSRSAGPAAT